MSLLPTPQVQRDFEELPPEAAEALRASILNLLIRFATGAAAVRTQLCLAMAAMAAHIPAKQWGQGGIVVWLAEHLSNQAQDVALPCMLELLTVIPEVSSPQIPSHLCHVCSNLPVIESLEPTACC